jgi:hypothetical protein
MPAHHGRTTIIHPKDFGLRTDGIGPNKGPCLLYNDVVEKAHSVPKKPSHGASLLLRVRQPCRRRVRHGAVLGDEGKAVGSRIPTALLFVALGQRSRVGGHGAKRDISSIVAFEKLWSANNTTSITREMINQANTIVISVCVCGLRRISPSCRGCCASRKVGVRAKR